MDTIKATLFEDPTYIYISLAFAELALAALWYERRTRTWLRALLVPPLLAAGVVALAALVETDREQILRAVDEMARDAEAGKVDAFERWLDDQFTGAYGAKAKAIDNARAEIRRYQIKEVAVMKKLTLDIAEDRARLRLSTIITFRDIGDKIPLMWDVRWVRREPGWRVLEVDQPRMGMDLRDR